MNIEDCIIYMFCIFLLVIICKKLIVPIKVLIKLIFNLILGLIFIYMVNQIVIKYNIHIGMNFFTLVYVGFLGLPGIVLLIILLLL